MLDFGILNQKRCCMMYLNYLFTKSGAKLGNLDFIEEIKPVADEHGETLN